MRPKIFLTFALLSILPLALIGVLTSYLHLRQTRQWLHAELQRELTIRKLTFEESINRYQGELRTVAQNSDLVNQVSIHQRESFERVEANGSPEIVEALTPLFADNDVVLSVLCFDAANRFLFQVHRATDTSARLRLEIDPVRQTSIDLTTSLADEHDCGIADSPAAGKMLRCLAPVTSNNQQIGTLVADLKLDAMFARVVKTTSDDASSRSEIIVLDSSGEIVYHENNALRHQLLSRVLPAFAPIEQTMKSEQTGKSFYRGSNGNDWYAVFTQLKQSGLSMAIAKDYTLAVRPVRRNAFLVLALAVALGVVTAIALSNFYQRQTRSIQRVTKDVTAIAEGDLDMQVDARSRDDMRDLAHSVNVMTGRLREQLARETEMRQIESFVRVAAMLTHDLKNAINGLSMYVANLENQFDSPTFRAESIEALTDATQKLQSLVDRLSNPMSSLSGEYKRPTPTDLVPMIRDLVKRTTSNVRLLHQVELLLPDKLVAYVDKRRIETVFENLLLNAFEALVDKPGKVTISGAYDNSGRVMVTIEDTGIGMTERFIEQKLFHAFATTKKKGMGLGLYTCREVVVACGGSIEVTSEVGVGTTFRVMLPSPPSDKAEA